ncbi:MAG: hypothetical protein PHP70_03405 [Gallionella sp.]|nr:hypothetical protein [Gallionella sp.]
MIVLLLLKAITLSHPADSVVSAGWLKVLLRQPPETAKVVPIFADIFLNRLSLPGVFEQTPIPIQANQARGQHGRDAKIIWEMGCKRRASAEKTR